MLNLAKKLRQLIGVTVTVGSVRFEIYRDHFDYVARREEQSCTSKMRHPNEEVANKVRLKMQKKTGDPFDAYECGFCDGWYTGHSLTRWEIPAEERN